MSVQLRPACLEDAPVLRTMIWALARYHGDFPAVTQDFLRAHAFSPEAADFFWIAEYAGHVVGFAKARLITDFARALRELDVDMLWVEDAQRGQGIGRRLIAAMAAEGVRRHCQEFRISARKGNAGAVAAYRKLGLQEKDKGDSLRFIGTDADLIRLAQLSNSLSQ